MFITYSPINPNKNICIEAIKKNPMTNGATPISKDSQLNNFKNKYTVATIKDKKLVINPIKVKILSGNFECLIMPKTAIS